MIDHSEKQCIGLIGLGLVGSELAVLLLQAGFHVAGYDIEDKQCDKMKEKGVEIRSSPASVAQCTKRIVLSLPNSPVVREVLLGKQGVLETAAPHTIILDTTTGDPESTKEIAKELQSREFQYIDACILGSSRHVTERQAVVIAGGSAEDIDSCWDILNTFAKDVYLMGENGKGSETKLVVNLVLGLNRFVLSEGLLLAEALKLDLQTVMDVLKSGVAYSRVMDTKGDKMLNHDYKPQARLGQHLKDVELILQTGKKAGVRLYLSKLHQNMLSWGITDGMGDLDNSAIYEILRKHCVE